MFYNENIKIYKRNQNNLFYELLFFKLENRTSKRSEKLLLLSIRTGFKRTGTLRSILDTNGGYEHDGGIVFYIKTKLIPKSE